MLIGSQPSQPDLTTSLLHFREIFNGPFETQDQGDSIQVTREVEKGVLRCCLRFLFPDKLKLKKDNGCSVTSLRCRAVPTHAITVFSPVSEIRQFPSFNF